MGFPGLGSHPYVLSRPVAGSDAEGNPVTGLTQVGQGVGHLEALSTSARARAAQAGQTVDAGLQTNMSLDARPGDILACRGRRWTVAVVEDLRTPLRILVAEER